MPDYPSGFGHLRKHGRHNAHIPTAMHKSLLNRETAQNLFQASTVEVFNTPFIKWVDFDLACGSENAEKLVEYICQQIFVLNPDEKQIAAKYQVNACILEWQVLCGRGQGF